MAAIISKVAKKFCEVCPELIKNRNDLKKLFLSFNKKVFLIEVLNIFNFEDPLNNYKHC